jgi:hypothetical protein
MIIRPEDIIVLLFAIIIIVIIVLAIRSLVAFIVRLVENQKSNSKL